MAFLAHFNIFCYENYEKEKTASENEITLWPWYYSIYFDLKHQWHLVVNLIKQDPRISEACRELSRFFEAALNKF